MHSRWKVSFYNIASEASYVYIWVDKKLTKKWSILANFLKPKACGQTMLPDNIDRTKIGENAKIEKLKWDIFKQCVGAKFKSVVFSNTTLKGK